jgi:hypothetical protein
MEEVARLARLPCLAALWLEGNPAAFHPGYRALALSFFLEPRELRLDGRAGDRTTQVQRTQQVANRDVRGFGWEIAHGAVSRRPPISLDTMVPRTGGYAYGVGVWDSFIVQGAFSGRAKP